MFVAVLVGGKAGQLPAFAAVSQKFASLCTAFLSVSTTSFFRKNGFFRPNFSSHGMQ
jgi:hypothetical protein